MKKIKVFSTAGAILFAVVASFAFKPANVTGRSITTGFYQTGTTCLTSGATDQSTCDVSIQTNLCTVTVSHTVKSPVFENGGTTCTNELYVQP
jgi:Family of unknown function (DUF6520)